MNQDRQRDGFEAWALGMYSLHKQESGEYSSIATHSAWTAWQAALASPEVQALRKDAERYRWLRQQHWSESEMCLVCRPKEAVRLGSYCPSLDLLDSHIDAAMEKQK